MINTILSVGIGGAFGAISRYGVNALSVKLFGDGFPWGTLIVNVLGSALMGAGIVILAQALPNTHNLKALLLTGFLGAFTTFSAFSLDVSILYERGQLFTTATYIAASVLLSITALFIAMALMRQFFA